jgi:hypothetical protein
MSERMTYPCPDLALEDMLHPWILTLYKKYKTMLVAGYWILLPDY